MWRDSIRRYLVEATWIVFAAVAMGSLIGVAHFADYGPAAGLDVGATTILVPLATGIALGLLLTAPEPEPTILKGFIASLGAVVFIGITVYAPVLTGTVPRLESLEPRDLGRLAAVFTSLLIVPVHLVGNILGMALQDLWPSPSETARGPGL